MKCAKRAPVVWRRGSPPHNRYFGGLRALVRAAWCAALLQPAAPFVRAAFQAARCRPTAPRLRALRCAWRDRAS